MDNIDGSETSDMEDESGTDNDTSIDLNDVSKVPYCDVQMETGELVARKVTDLGRIIRPKDRVFEMKDLHNINLTYNKAYKSKDHALYNSFGNPWESFKMLPTFLYMLEQSKPGTITYGFMALVACVEGFNAVIRPFITIDVTHLKA
ncbi:hypothetical protein Ddye_021400 [Dipteronia dyeriana]|uniref:Uncharacterized protein n=1 Tax=Dipteronia dyeriana TaxID=168575 RepID=A0AAD9U1I8_9ROSI|nr:hypothetical protein Ddye_021400 [Dipteronia dyeriana]